MRIQIVFFITTILVCELFAVVWGSLPPEVQKCKSTQNDECIGRTIEDILKRYPTGNPTFGMPNISALNITNLKISRSNPSSPIQISFQFLNCTIYGMEKSKILKSSGFDNDLKKIEVIAVANLRLKGDYEMTGKILLLPINGKGTGTIDLVENKAIIRVKMDKEKRNNRTHFKVNKFKVSFNPKKMIVKFENLFNGNPVLSETINEVINENWKDVWQELQEGINRAGAIILENALKEVYEVLALEDMYAD